MWSLVSHIPIKLPASWPTFLSKPAARAQTSLLYVSANDLYDKQKLSSILLNKYWHCILIEACILSRQRDWHIGCDGFLKPKIQRDYLTHERYICLPMSINLDSIRLVWQSDDRCASMIIIIIFQWMLTLRPASEYPSRPSCSVLLIWLSLEVHSSCGPLRLRAPPQRAQVLRSETVQRRALQLSLSHLLGLHER